MNVPLSTALHPVSFEFSQKVPGATARAGQRTQWSRIHGTGCTPPHARLIGEHPLVASESLQLALDQHVAELGSFVTSRVAARHGAVAGWPAPTPPDVLCADLAIVADPTSPQGWSLRWVEFQAFASIISTVYTLHLCANEMWPETRELLPWQLPAGESDWLRAAKNWAAPAGGILLEHAPLQQGTRFDLQVASKLFGLPLVEPSQLSRVGSALSYRDDSGTERAVNHVFNRLVMHELTDRSTFERVASDADVTWHSHPAWYYGISKGWLPDLPQRPGARCAQAKQWRSLGLPAEALVAKNAHSHGGAAVLLHVDAHTLDTLHRPENWIVQPRYAPQPLFRARDGHPIFGEIRCIMAMPRGLEPWLAGQFMRLSRGAKASVSGLDEMPGSGLAVLYRPPER